MAKQPWLRLYTAILDSPKIQLLPDKLFRALVNLWCVAKEYDGRLPPASTCAWRLRVPTASVKRWLSDLEARGLIDHCESGDLIPHDWGEHQYELVETVTGDHNGASRVTPGALRQKRYREHQKASRVTAETSQSVTESVTVTRHLARARDQNRTEQNPPTPRNASDADPNCAKCGGSGTLWAIDGGELEQWQRDRDYTRAEPCDCNQHPPQ